MLGEFGPFKPNKPVLVPLWLAIYLKLKNKCRINPPSILESEQIQIYLKREKEDNEFLTQIPDHFFEIANIFLKE